MDACEREVCRWHRRRDGVPDEIDARILQWVQWTRGAVTPNGWPARTVLARVIEEGAHGSSQSGNRPEPEMPANVLEVDRIVARMHPRLRRALRAVYLSALPVEIKAKQMHLSVSTLRNRVESARWYIAAAIEHRNS